MKCKNIFSKFSALLLAVLLIAAAIPCVSAGEDVTADGLRYELADGKVTVTGYVGDETKLVIPEKIENTAVTRIYDCAFEGCDFIEEVVISEGVEEIGYEAFRDCSALAKIELPTTLVSVGREAFLGTAYERNGDNWQDGVLYIGNVLVMSESDALSAECAVKADTTVLASQSFIFCHGVSKITLPEGVEYIGEDAFKDCDALESIVIPKSVTEIGSSAFEGCSALKSVYYSGTTEDWSKIAIGDYNDVLSGVSMYYTNTGAASQSTQVSAEKSAESGFSGGAHNDAGWVKYCIIAVVLAAGCLVVFFVRSKRFKTDKNEDNSDEPSTQE